MQFAHFIQQSIGFLAPMKKDLAYLDPGTGSFLLQLLLATFLGGLFLIKAYWKRLKGFFARIFSRNRQADQPEETPPTNEPK